MARNKRILGIVVILCLVSILSWLLYGSRAVITDIGYYTRPIWDKNPQIFTYIPHYYAQGIPRKDLCELHGWTERPTNERTPRVYDAIIFSVELDLLEIRIHELWDVVDEFIILESNATFTGLVKPLVFEENKERFAFAASKLHHTTFDQYALPPGASPFTNENEMRRRMNQIFVERGVVEGDIIFMSDVDEIVRSETMELLKHCKGVPPVLHLQLRNYVYSFEFFVDYGSWRAHIAFYVPGETGYRHGQVTDAILVDAGWHCSYCFRTLHEFQFKMQGFSHADRVRYTSLLESDRIQRVICSGGEIFDMPPEAYTYKDLISRMGNVPKQLSAVGLPSYLLKNAQKFKFLLPGGCMRESTPDV
ncbi:N-acetylglucosaminyltransferase-like protein [Spinellus fusiger]|nr:N-acetylglucosaminyltransferase-like protein [Spinellus fusiger]